MVAKSRFEDDLIFSPGDGFLDSTNGGGRGVGTDQQIDDRVPTADRIYSFLPAVHADAREFHVAVRDRL